MGTLYAVLTGDIIASSDLPDEERQELPVRLQDAFSEVVRAIDPGRQAIQFSMVRGDGWQSTIRDSSLALGVAVRYACLLSLQGYRTRLALAIDHVDTVREDLNESSGPAFQRSGRALDEMDDEIFRCLGPGHAELGVQVALESIGEIVDLLLSGWTLPQQQAIAAMLENYPHDLPTQSAIAENWHPEKVTRQTIHRHLDRAEWSRLKRTLERYRGVASHLSEAMQNDDY